MDIRSIVEVKPNPNIPELNPGDLAKVSIKVVEGNRERTQVFEGTVIQLRDRGHTSNFTVRRISHGVGIERTFMLNSPSLEKVEVLRHGKVRRAKLYYLRGLTGKMARIKEETRVRAKRKSEEQPQTE